MSRYRITETVMIQTFVTADNEEQARSKAYERLPDYGKAGWDLTWSEGPEIMEI